MAYGNKKSKKTILIFVIMCISLICLLCALVIIDSDKEPDVFKDYITTGFFTHLLHSCEKNEINVYSIDAYYYEQNYYYRVSFSEVSVLSGEWEVWELVYYGYKRIQWFINPHWEEWAGGEVYYEAYLEAVKRGQHKSFSQEEIQKYIDQYYVSLEN